MERPEIKAWTNLITLKEIPKNMKEIERLKKFEILEQENSRRGKRRGKKDAGKDKKL